ncbi:MAG: histidinol dehydrogenase [Paludibacteraceae bacterium]|nr:histidinol dehydrogenase [Paludibacteraceae bacterium]
MQYIRYPKEEDIPALITRPHFDHTALTDTVRGVLNDVRERGDSAVFDYEEQFDHVRLDSLQVSEKELAEAESLVGEDLKQAIRQAKENIAAFHAAQDQPLPSVETMPGVRCWQKAVAIEKVGLYIPGGTAPLFSTVLMLAVPARIAGCREIVLCTPPNREGKVHPAVLFAATVAGVSRIFKIGGVQAIGSMAYGTETVPKVYKIFGPGNQYVTAAKQMVSLSDVAIDMPAGPSEVEVIADETSNPAFVAADLLSQAEHGADSQAILVTTSDELAEKVVKEVEEQLERLPRKELASKSLSHSRIILVEDRGAVVRLTNAYAPEHLIISARNPHEIADAVTNAGSIFIGPYTCESAGDYASGTNHTLPTSGYAHAYSGVNLDSFRKKMTYQEIDAKGLTNIGAIVETMAEAEQLFAHRNAMTLRLQSLEKQS